MYYFITSVRYVPPPPSRPRFNQNNNDIETNEIPNNRENNIGANGYASKNYNDYNKQNNYDGFFVNIPPKFYKSAAKQQYYQQQQLNDILNQNYYSKTNKYNIIAFKDKYYNVPYYVVSNWHLIYKRPKHFPIRANA